MGISMGLAFTSVAALCVETVPPDHRAIAMGGYNSAIYLGMMVSAAGLGVVIGWLGYAWTYALMGLIVALSAGGFYLLIRDYSISPQ